MRYKEYDSCELCPRECRVNRNKGEKGFCGESSEVKLGRAALHHWEEPCISGNRGSGTVFFSGCNLRCCYCQNFNLSRGKEGVKTEPEKLSDIFIKLQSEGAHNINLVTAEHYAPHIKATIADARKKGLTLPVILNSSGYVSEKTLEILKDVIDIYLVDFKYMNSIQAKKYSLAPDYPEIVKKAIDKMVRFTGNKEFDSEGILQRGVIVRHLCLPSHTEDSKKIIEYVYKRYGERVVLSIMSQYTPQRANTKFKELSEKLTQNEYDDVIDFCINLGIEDAYIQDGESASESFIPSFNGEGVN